MKVVVFLSGFQNKRIASKSIGKARVSSFIMQIPFLITINDNYYAQEIETRSGFLTHQTTLARYLFESMDDLRPDPSLPNFTVNVEFMSSLFFALDVEYARGCVWHTVYQLHRQLYMSGVDFLVTTTAGKQIAVKQFFVRCI